MAFNLKINPEDHFGAVKLSCRSTLKATAAKIIKKLTDAQLQLFRESQVGKLIDVQIGFQGMVIHNLLLREIDDNILDSISFFVGGKKITFGLDEFRTVTGLNTVSDLIIEPTIGFRKQYLNDSVSITLEDLEGRFDAIKEDDDDLFVVKLALLLFVESVLLGKEKKVQIEHDLVLLIDDLERFNEFDFGKLVYSSMIEKLRKSMKNRLAKYQVGVQKNPRHVEKYSIYGFTSALQVSVS